MRTALRDMHALLYPGVAIPWVLGATRQAVAAVAAGETSSSQSPDERRNIRTRTDRINEKTTSGLKTTTETLVVGEKGNAKGKGSWWGTSNGSVWRPRQLMVCFWSKQAYKLKIFKKKNTGFKTCPRNKK